MKRKCVVSSHCNIANALEQVGEWWTLLIVRECMNGKTRFDEFQRGLGIARNILTTRLERMIELEILEQFPLEERAGSFGYRLTPKGRDLYPVLVTLMQWGDKWLEDKNPQVTLVDSATNSPVQRIAVHSADGRELSFDQVKYAPGPGATENTQAIIDTRNKRMFG